MKMHLSCRGTFLGLFSFFLTLNPGAIVCSDFSSAEIEEFPPLSLFGLSSPPVVRDLLNETLPIHMQPLHSLSASPAS